MGVDYLLNPPRVVKRNASHACIMGKRERICNAFLTLGYTGVAMRKLLSALAILLGLLLAGPLCFHVLQEPDAGWHLAIGRLIASTGIPRTNALSWTFPDEPWYATSWLYDWAAAALTTRWGALGLQSFTFLLVAGTIVFAALAAARTNPKLGPWFAPVVALSMLPRITERPHLASSLLLALVLWLCVGQPLASWPRRAAAVLLVALFSNLHAGAIFPAVIVAAFCLQAFAQSRKPLELGLAVAAGLALLCNPGGLFNLRYIVTHLNVREVIPVAELAAPTFANVPDFFIAIGLGVVLAWRERRSPALVAALVLYAALAFRAVRFAWDFELIVAIALAQTLRTFRWQPAVPLVVGVALLIVRWPFYSFLQVRPAFDEQTLPVRAAQFIEAKGVAGRGYNALRDGGYLEWRLPAMKWFQDTRLQAYPDSFFQAEQIAEQSAVGLRHWAAGRGAEWAIASRLPERMAGYSQFESPEWALIYWDQTSEVWLRRDVPRFEPLIKQYEYRHFRPLKAPEIATITVPDLIAWDAELQRFEENGADFPPAAIIHCGVLKRLGGSSDDICARAERLATTDEMKTAVSRMRGLQQAH